MTISPQMPSPKLDPETLVLRARPVPAIRFRRSVIIGIAAAAALFIAGAAGLALQPVTKKGVKQAEEKMGGSAQPAADALVGAPTNYAEVPQLGAPLPPVLGRPILARQRALGAATPGDGSGNAHVDAAAERTDAERQRLNAERRAARESGVMLRAAASPDRNGNEMHIAPASADDDPGLEPAGEPPENVNIYRLERPASQAMLQAGSVIAASLITGLDSELAGVVTAQVTQHAFDSVTGQKLLIPQGSRLIGKHDNLVAYGQRRALVVWHRIILPDGSSIRIDNLPASDTQGHTGLADRVDRHSWQLLKGVVLSTLLGVGTEVGWKEESDIARALRETIQQNGARAGDQLVGRSLDIAPTLKVRPGWPLRVVVNKDIILEPWQHQEPRDPL